MMGLRGSAAHGILEVRSDEEFDQVSSAVRAMELLCFMLTVVDLPIPIESFDRIWQYPLLTEYL